MCTAVTFNRTDHYFGRNLDLEYRYREAVTITPRNYPFVFRRMPDLTEHYGMIGMATVEDGYPLYSEATNEYGLSMAGLNFPGNAVYYPEYKNKDNITPYEFIPWILGQCKNLQEARALLEKINIVGIAFSEKFPLSPLHWIIADGFDAVTVETLKNGMSIYENPVGVLTNNPPFDFHMHHLNNYLNLTSTEPENWFSGQIELVPYSRGMGAIGLPGDLSSSSRFVRAAFTKWNSKCGDSEAECISQFFHILASAEQQRGCVKTNGSYEKTIYSSCCNGSKGIYYYTTYENCQITGIDMNRENLDGNTLVTYPIRTETQIFWEN